ncbi:hypothetical protein [Yinghuangia soli]|uniref:Uncharacterized protein n=1 Tax=Yinghuangia soli TaxID=2908204 RepID=A0AA41U6E6_9ACTN|nr:hypothetical protein [Yinghuangia soli]MCF2532892.1 hypothetical protein [Yinghuangia soli]
MPENARAGLSAARTSGQGGRTPVRSTVDGTELRVMRSALRSLLGPNGAVRASVGAGALGPFPG